MKKVLFGLGRIIYGGAYGFPRGVDIILTDQTLLTPEEASRYLRLSVESVYNLLRQGELEGKKTAQGWVIERSYLESLLEAWGEREELPD